MKASLLLFAVLSLLPAAAQADQRAAQPWIVHSSFADFAAGTFPDGGSNLYARHTGGLEMIHRWDYNNDGFLDLVAGNDHNMLENEDAYIYWNGPQGLRSLLPEVPTQQPLARLLHEIKRREGGLTRLPSDGGGRALVTDLNRDGHPDIVFCNAIHNYSVNTSALVYWGGPDGYGSARRTVLPTLMATGVAAADFNQDGFLDLVFSNHGIEEGERFGLDHHLESYVYWGGPMGFSAENRTAIPSISAVSCAAGDLNGDGYPELVLANNNEQEKSVYVYWGGRAGLAVERRTVINGGDPVGIALADLNRDGREDLVLTHRNGKVELRRNTGQGLESTAWSTLPTAGASQAQVADLNRDGYPDLVLACEGTTDRACSLIYWGGPAGFSTERCTELPTLHATEAALADFNGDGWIDVAFANEHDGATYDVNSYIYWNSPQGFAAAARQDLQGFGAVSIQAADLNHDGRPEAVLINRNSGALTAIDAFIYWGNAAHYYSTSAMTTVRGAPGTTLSSADFDQDGWLDLAFANGLVYLNGPRGYDSARSVNLGVKDGFGTAVGDFNRDGWLDLAFTAGLRDTSRVVCFWGGPGGLSPARKTEIPLHTRISLSLTAADLNKDGHLDLICSDLDTDLTEVLWGGPAGPDAGRTTRLTLRSAATVEVADFNGDGWLDLFLGGGYDQKTPGRPGRQATIAFGAGGGTDGYQIGSTQQLEAFQSNEQAVADFNRDGFLDIALTNYHAGTTRTLPSFVYWGGPDGYSPARRANLPGESTSAITAADLNQDGWIDLFVMDHVKRGDHGVDGNIFWGSPQGFAYERRQTVPTFGVHFGERRDIGNIYTRRLQEDYLSPALNLPSGRRLAGLTWSALTPHGTAVTFQIRSAPTEAELVKAPWHGSADSPDTYLQSGPLAVPAGHRWIQYKATFRTPDGGSTPRLERVELTLEP